MLHGEKVFLRAIEPEDLIYLHKWFNDPEVAKYTWPGVPTPTPLEKMQANYEKDWCSEGKSFLICTQENQKPIGFVEVKGIAIRSRKGNLTIIIGETEYWGKGYGSQALVLFLNYCFRVMNLRRVALEVYEYNERAIKSYEKIGFQHEGRVRRSIFKDGRYFDEFVMAIFQDDFLKR